ncbi:hypothetical protein H4S07_003339 [Coemansia furcata]|uniref:Uncharacterized protein n=1 Tax=Coemansia furcata TaxID=417177 RepID=A0ACC1LHJ0_9FUNG|nr:hypothetical protein H4S07_003339 [Coemansia furcata]
MNPSEPEINFPRRRWAYRTTAEAGLLDEHGRNEMIDDMNMMKCDTPVYVDFVKGFLQTTDTLPTAKIARKLCETWPLPKPTTTEAATLRVAVMDSSFNPPHYCHGAYMECMGILKLKSEDQRQQNVEETYSLDIDAFLLLLGSKNADKSLQGASLAQRMRMVDMLATTVAVDTTSDTWHSWKKRDQFLASNLHNMAIGMVNTPRFIDKCQAVRDVVHREYKGSGELPQVLCYFAMGWDTLIRFFDAKYYGSDFPAEIDRFFADGGRIAYARRTGFLDSDVEEFFAAPHMKPYLTYIYEMELPKRVKHISSTEVRRAICESSHGVRDIPPRILQYVNSNQLYRD